MKATRTAPRIIILALLLLIGLSIQTQSAIIRVKTDGNDSNDGSTWALAKRTVQAALTASISGGEVWVKAGTYTQCFTLTSGVGLYGGFAGAETARSDRDRISNPTILDGNQSGSVVTCPPGATISTTIDGFTIRNGKALSGGGVYCTQSGPTISNNIIIDNRAYTTGSSGNCNSGSGGYGGGIYCSGTSTPLILNNVISRNSAASWLGECCTPPPYSYCFPIWGGGAGGGIYCSSCTPTISGNIVIGNIVDPFPSASSGGAIYLVNCTGSVSVSSNLIAGNRSAGNVFESNGTAVVTNNMIVCNGYGGIRCSGTILNNTIIGNGGLNQNTGVAIYTDVASTICNNLVAFNASGIQAISGSTLRNNCVYGNNGLDYAGVSPGVGDISVDPQLADQAYGNLHLQAGSPCVDAGWDGAAGLPTTDFDGQTRILDGDSNGIAHVDIGADESTGSTWALGPYAVIRVAPDGNDLNDGASWLQAKRTLQAAVDSAVIRGGEVWVRSGSYNECVRLTPYSYVYGGFSGKETQRNQRDWRANSTIVDGQGSSAPVVSVYGLAGIRSAIDGFTIRNGAYGISAYNQGYERVPTTQPTLRVTNNRIVGNVNAGIRLPEGAMVANNEIGPNNGKGIVFDSATSATVTNNSVVGNSSQSVFITPEASAYLANNVIAFNGAGIYRQGAAGTQTLLNNCVFGNTSYNYSGLSAGTGDISLDPLFVNYSGGDYHLTASSPCKNAGLNTASGIPSFDIDGQVRLNGTVDIGSDEYWTSVASIRDARNSVNLGGANINGAIVSAAFPDFFYIEYGDKPFGIRVNKAGHTLAEGMKADIYGIARTSPDGEKYILASTAVQSAPPGNTGAVYPAILTNASLGGANAGYDLLTGAGQCGVLDARGPNNIGLLVTTSGKVMEKDTAVPATWFRIDDGCGASSKVVVPSIVTVLPNAGDYVTVTGISSCEKPGSDLLRLLRVRKQSDILKCQ